MVIAILLLIAAAAVTLDLTQAQAANGVYDTDGDRLIEVSSLEQLDAIRHDLDGDGRADSASYNPRYAAAFPASGSEAVCAAGCADYELKLSLDFDSAGSYAGDINYAWSSLEGWPPINGFRATFDGNGNTISNLYVNRSDADNIGLFGSGGRTAAIKGIGLLNADVTGQRNVGTLLGRNTGTVSYSCAAGSATSVVGDHNTGGLVGANEGTVTTSYASVTIALPRGSAGGLVGMNYEGTISSSYATGPVSSGGSFVGGWSAKTTEAPSAAATPPAE